MDIDDTSQRLSGVTISGSLKERQSNEAGDGGELSEEDKARYTKYIQRAKRLVEEGEIAQAVLNNKKALQIYHTVKLARKIKKMEDYLAANADDSSEDDNNGMVEVGNGFYVYKDLYNKLYAHQKEGVLWLWSLYKKKKGGILGDDMGLGKTIQVIGFLSGLFDMGKIKSVLIVLPVAVMVNWENEFNKWAPGLKVESFHGNSKREKERALSKVQRRGGICLTTYGLVVTSWEQLGQREGVEFTWDYMILDEGHKIKNPTKTSKGVHAIPARNRIILTGTPVQNNLKELWSLFDFVHQGSLLGTQKTFKMEYDTPITRARQKDATIGEKRLGMEMAESLKRIIAPYFLRRTKAEVKNSENKENTDPEKQMSIKMPTMTRKNDLIVWLFMSEAQLNIYKDFIELDSVKELLMTKKSPLVALTVLKKICDHPRLLSSKACAQLGIAEGLDDELLETEAAELSAATVIQHVADEVLIKESGKLVFLIKLLDQLKVEGHRCLVFSQSRKILDIMQKVLTNKGHKVQRLDGTIRDTNEREQRIKNFQTDMSFTVFLLTTQVGGVGLTLTAADRVVIFDPSWNPATDAQAVDRAFRIGQDKNVVIYRLITCGTLEEKIYRRQIFKDSITRQTTGNAKNPHRYFTNHELKELFTLDNPDSSTTQQQLEQMHSGHRLTDPSLDSHIAYLYTLNMFGLSDHDLMFSQGASAGDEQDVDDLSECPGDDYIQHRVNKAQQLIEMESSQPIPLEERQGTMQKAESGNQGNRNQYEGWDIPRPGTQHSRRSDEEIPIISTLPPAQRYGNEIDLTESPHNPVAMASEDEAIDVSSDEEEDVKHEIKLEKQEVKEENIKKENNIPTTTPIKIEKKEKYHLDSDVVMNSPKTLQTKLNTENDLNMHVDEHYSNDSEHMEMNISIDEANSHRPITHTPKQTPQKTSHTPRTPVRNDNGIIAEELLISPDSSRPLIMTEPKSRANQGNKVKQHDQASKLNATILSNLADTPNVLETSAKSSVSSTGSASPRLVHKTFIEDSPAIMMNQSIKSKRLVISDLPENSGSDEESKNLNQSIKMEASMLADSLLEESMVDEKNEVHSATQSFNRSRRRENKKLEKSMHDLGLDDDALPDLDTNTGAKSFVHDDDLPDIDSPVVARSGNKSKSFKKHVIESSDENSDAENNDDRNLHDDNNESVENVGDDADEEENESVDHDEDSDKQDNGSDEEMDHSGNDEDSTGNQFIDNEAGADGMVEEEDEGEEYGEEEELSEETDEEEEDDGVPDFNSLPEKEQERYNSLVDTGRNYCKQKEFEKAQLCVLQALDIFPDPMLQITAQQIYRKVLKYQAMREQGTI